MSLLYGNENWEFVKLGEVCETSSGGTPKTDNADYYNGDILWFQSGEVCEKDLYKSQKTITELGLKNSSAKIFPKNTVLMAMYGATAGQVGILRVEASTNQAICGIIPNNKLISEFLYYYLETQITEIKNKRLGAAQPNLTQGIIQDLQIPLPPLEIQQEIIEKMNEKNEYIKLTEQLINRQKLEMQKIIFALWKI